MPKTSTFSALKVGNFRLLIIGHATSVLGDGAYLTTVSWFAFNLSGDASSVAIVLGALSVATLCSLLIGGALADRYDRRMLIVISDGGRAICVAILAVLVASGSGSVTALAVVVGLAGLFDGLFYPAFSGLVSETVPEELRASANSMVGLVRSAGTVLGPVLGGLLYTALGPVPAFALNAVSFAGSMGCLLAFRAAPRKRGKLANPFPDILAGGKYLLSVPILASIPIAAVALMISDAPLQTLLPALVVEQFKGDAVALGALNSAFGIGAALGALGYGFIRLTRRRAIVVYACWAAAHVFAAGLALTSVLPLAIVLAIFKGGLGGFGFAIWETLLMHIVPPDKLSRVFSADTFGSMALLPVGFALAGALASIAPASVLIAIGQLTAGAMMIGLLLFRRIRSVQ